MQPEKHIINKVFLEIHTRSSKTAYELKDDFDVFLKEKLLPYLGEYFDSLAKRQPPDTHFQLDKTEIEITAKAPLDLDTLKISVKNKLEKEVEKAQVFNCPTVSASKEERFQDHFFHFFETGTDSWWNRSGKISVLQDPLEFKALISSPEFALKLLKKLQKSRFRSRMIKQLGDGQLKMILKNDQLGEVCPSPLIKAVVVDKIAACVKKGVAGSGPFTLEQRLQIWDIVFCTVVDPIDSETKHKLFRLIRSILKPFQGVLPQPSVEKIIRKSLLRRNSVTVLNSLERTILNLKKAVITATGKSKKEPSNKESAIKEHPKKGVLRMEDAKIEGQAIDDKTSLTPEQETLATTLAIKEHDQLEIIAQSGEHLTFETPEDHYVENAGLILIHPYLKQLFLNCELLHLDKIANPEKAIHLLHYLATGEEQQFEHRMVFEKFLCNMPISHSINRNIALSDVVKGHVEEMLVAVLHNWTAMGKASTDLLRNEFLQRPGKLILTENNPKIILEKKTQDILLDKLPWNLGLCKLPWRDKIIFTDW